MFWTRRNGSRLGALFFDIYCSLTVATLSERGAYRRLAVCSIRCPAYERTDFRFDPSNRICVIPESAILHLSRWRREASPPIEHSET